MLIADDPKKTLRTSIAEWFALYEFVWWWPLYLWVKPQIHHYVYVPSGSKKGPTVKWILFLGPLQIIHYTLEEKRHGS